MNHLLLVFLIIFIQLYAVEGFLPFRYGGITLRIDKRLIANIKTTTGNDFSKVYNSAIIGGKSTVVTVSASKVDEFGESMRKYDIPNKLTLARIYAIPLFVLAFILHRRATALGIYIFSCLTDFLDGYLARKWQQTTPMGAFLDPVADKLMVASALILLTATYPSYLYILPVVLIMCREIAISALREWMASQGVRDVVRVGMLGKIKTSLQMVATSLLLLVVPGFSLDLDLCQMFGWSKLHVFVLGLMILYLSTIAAIVSGVQYFRAAWSVISSVNTNTTTSSVSPSSSDSTTSPTV